MTTYSPTLSTNAHGILSGSVYLPVPVYRASAFNTATGSMAAIGTTPLAAYKSGNVVSFLAGAVATDIEYRPNTFTVTNLTQDVSQIRVKFETTGDSAWDEWGTYYFVSASASIYDIAFIGT